MAIHRQRCILECSRRCCDFFKNTCYNLYARIPIVSLASPVFSSKKKEEKGVAKVEQIYSYKLYLCVNIYMYMYADT